MGFKSIISFAHQCAAERVQPGETVVDATAGNGNDTFALAKLVGPSGHVHAFDVQPEAIAATRTRLESGLSNPPQLSFHLRSHAEMKEALPAEQIGSVAAVMFNLGYLPGEGDKRIITRTESTIPALEAAVRLLRKGGILTIVVYPGHEGGDKEANAVADWCGRLPQDIYQCLEYRFVNRQAASPYLLAVEKKQSML